MKDRLPTIANILPAAVLDESKSGSLRHSVANAHRNASLVRDRLSLDTWRIVHHIERMLKRAADSQISSDPLLEPPVASQVFLGTALVDRGSGPGDPALRSGGTR